MVLAGKIRRLASLLCVIIGLGAGLPALAKDGEKPAGNSAADPISSLAWQTGAGSKNITDKATIKTTDELAVLDGANTRKFLQLTGNLPVDNHYLVMHAQNQWWSVFSFDDIGYVKDDEKINPDELLKSLKEHDEAANERRKGLGLDAIFTDGWSTPPHYDAQTKQLEWGLRIRDSKGATNLNYTIRILGRSGVMNATLVTTDKSFDQDVQQFREALKGFEFNSGQQYSEFKQGDKLAKVGLAALVLGGAAAVATKKGFWAAMALFFAKAWKLVLVGLAAIGVGIGKLFGRKSSE